MSFIRQLFQLITAPFRWLFSLPLSIISAPRRLFGLSLPARVAWLTALLLLFCAVAAFVSVLLTEDRADTWNYWWRWQTPVLVLLLIAIPPVVYYAVRSWLEGEVSRYPDIDEAWQAGLAALAENGLDPTELPLFLILGSGDERLIKALFQASGLELPVRHVPPGRAALHWYASPDAVYLVSSGAGQLSRLTAIAGEGPRSGGAAEEARAADPRGTLGAFASQPSDSFPPAEGGLPGDSVVGRDSRGTLVPGAMSEGVAAAAGGGSPVAAAGALTRRDAEQQGDRLRYVCRLLSRCRQPLCPLNGILTLLPFRTVSDVLLAKDIPGAVQNDLAAVRAVARVRCSVTALVTGMESERGFGELVRRVGASRAKTNRFGKGYNVWNPPTAENIDAFSSHACGAFEDWVYSLFREQDGLSKPGNAKLYALLCKIRSELRGRLRLILLHGYSFDPADAQAEQDALLFSGCYFAASGDSEDRQAFVRNVFDKMLDLEEEVEWTETALAEDDRYHALARFVMSLSGLLVAALIAMVVYKFFLK